MNFNETDVVSIVYANGEEFLGFYGFISELGKAQISKIDYSSEYYEALDRVLDSSTLGEFDSCTITSNSEVVRLLELSGVIEERDTGAHIVTAVRDPDYSSYRVDRMAESFAEYCAASFCALKKHPNLFFRSEELMAGVYDGIDLEGQRFKDMFLGELSILINGRI